MKPVKAERLGVTIAFTLGAACIAASAFLLAATGLVSGLDTRIDSWPQAAGVFVGYSVFAGLVVDALRSVLDYCWPEAFDRGSQLRRT